MDQDLNHPDLNQKKKKKKYILIILVDFYATFSRFLSTFPEVDQDPAI